MATAMGNTVLRRKMKRRKMCLLKSALFRRLGA